MQLFNETKYAEIGKVCNRSSKKGKNIKRELDKWHMFSPPERLLSFVRVLI